jgi:hypothetical protein
METGEAAHWFRKLWREATGYRQRPNGPERANAMPSTRAADIVPAAMRKARGGLES